MNVIKWTEVLLLSLTLMCGFAGLSHAEESVGEKVEEAAGDVKKNTKQAYRNAKDKTCEWVKGKMECAGEKVKHGAKDVSDEVKDKVDAE